MPLALGVPGAPRRNGGLGDPAAHPEDSGAFRADVQAVRIQEGQVRIRVQGANVCERVVCEGGTGLGPVQPLEGDVLQGGRQAVPMVDGRQPYRAIRIVAHQDVAAVPVRVRKTYVQDCNLCHLPNHVTMLYVDNRLPKQRNLLFRSRGRGEKALLPEHKERRQRMRETPAGW